MTTMLLAAPWWQEGDSTMGVIFFTGLAIAMIVGSCRW